MPDYQFSDISRTLPKAGQRYLFDANVWIIILTPPEDLKPYEAKYVRFFEAFFSFDSENPPKIVVPDLILSEVINAHMNNCWNAYDYSMTMKYKTYRQTEDFQKKLSFLKDDLYSYSEVLEEPVKCFDFIKVVDKMPDWADFNDFCYYKYAQHNQYKLVTNDGDFVFEGVEIITNNNRLLQRSKSSTK